MHQSLRSLNMVTSRNTAKEGIPLSNKSSFLFRLWESREVAGQAFVFSFNFVLAYCLFKSLRVLEVGSKKKSYLKLIHVMYVCSYS